MKSHRLLDSHLLLMARGKTKEFFRGRTNKRWWQTAFLFTKLNSWEKMESWGWKPRCSQTHIQLLKSDKPYIHILKSSLFSDSWWLVCSGFPSWCSGKESACQYRRCNRHRFNPCVSKIPWSRKWQPIPVFLPGKFHGRKSLVGYNPWGCEESDMIEHTHTFCKLKHAMHTQGQQHSRTS